MCGVPVIQEWTAILDERQQVALEDAWFTYRVRRTQAATLVDTLAWRPA